MKKGLALAVSALVAFACAAPAGAQGNDNDYTPLNSRIRRDQKYPTDLAWRWRNDVDAVTKAHSKAMLSQFSRCLYNRSREGARTFLDKTDYGFRDFAQIGLDANRAMKNYGFDNCMLRVANTNDSGVMLRFSPGALRQWLLQEAYLYAYPEGPTWLREGIEVAERSYPLSGANIGVRSAMTLADCVVTADPFTADYFFRTQSGSPEEQRALAVIGPLMSPCLPRGQQVELQIPLVRTWIGEALWHAATNSALSQAPASSG